MRDPPVYVVKGRSSASLRVWCIYVSLKPDPGLLIQYIVYTSVFIFSLAVAFLTVFQPERTNC